MKTLRICSLVVCAILFLLSIETAAQDQSSRRSKKAEAAHVAGKAAAEVGKAAVKIGVIATKATAKHVVIPAAKVVWNPILKKGAPKLVTETAKLTGKGIKNGFKLIFRRDKAKSSSASGT